MTYWQKVRADNLAQAAERYAESFGAYGHTTRVIVRPESADEVEVYAVTKGRYGNVVRVVREDVPTETYETLLSRVEASLARGRSGWGEAYDVLGFDDQKTRTLATNALNFLGALIADVDGVGEDLESYLPNEGRRLAPLLIAIVRPDLCGVRSK
jgi:hypothetical protein